VVRNRRDRAEADPTARVRVFINHLDFARAWQFAHSKITGRNLDLPDKANAQVESQHIRWDVLPEAILDQLEQMDYIGEVPKEMRAIDVYASVSRANDGAKAELEKWLDESLDPLPGFQVHTFVRKASRSRPECNKCGALLEKSELVKGLNTKVACDMLSHAVNDSYDIGVVMMDDAELVPSILCVQEIFDKQIIHVGPKNRGDALRSAAWGNFLLEDIIPDIITSDDFKKQYTKKRRV
jgi:hypothetical protein